MGIEPTSEAWEAPVLPLNYVERAMGIEPTSEAWEAPVLPLNYARSLFLIVLRN